MGEADAWPIAKSAPRVRCFSTPNSANSLTQARASTSKPFLFLFLPRLVSDCEIPFPVQRQAQLTAFL